jgi:hypothetical protein
LLATVASAAVAFNVATGAVSRRLSSKAEPEGRIGGASQRSDTKTARGSVEAKAKNQDPKEAGRLIEGASWRSTGGFSWKVDRQRKLEIGPKAAEG